MRTETAAAGMRRVAAAGGGGLAEALPRLLLGLPDATAAVNLLDRFLEAAPGAAGRLGRDLSLLQALLVLFSHSQFLAESLIQSPDQLVWLDEARRLDRVRSRDELAAELATYTAPVEAGDRAASLTRFKRREYLRIVLRDLQGLSTLAETTQELSHLADAVLVQAWVWAWNDLVTRFGAPVEVTAEGEERVAEMAVIGLGKLGGEELNYSSDIDLMFLYSADGETDARGSGVATTNREFFIRLAQEITRYVSQVTSEGVAYRVDLRLRPDGSAGEIALPLERALQYYRKAARDWEWQMLIRARHCAGSEETSQFFLRAMKEFVYRPGHGAEALRSVLDARQRIQVELERRRAARRRATLDVKLDEGGIRDLEFLVQALQRLHGAEESWVRCGNTLIALQRLHDKGCLSSGEMQQLSSAHWLLRNVEHRLQLDFGQQTHSLPESAERLDALARSLLTAEGGRRSATWLAGYQADPEADSDRGDRLLRELKQHMASVRAIYQARVAGPAAGEDAEAARGAVDGTEQTEPATRHGGHNLRRLQEALASRPEGGGALGRLSPAGRKRLLRTLDASDYLTEVLLRRPSLLEGFNLPAAAAAEWDWRDQVWLRDNDYPARMNRLRRSFQERLFRLMADEIETAPPIARTLGLISHFADHAIEAALRIAAAEHSPGLKWPESSHGLAVLALGRLGLGELDIFSDVDLIFVAPDEQREAARGLAQRLIEVLTSYTQEGMLFAVDTRLRAGGREGELVQSPAAVREYFEQRAEAWEAVTYLKARAVAGDRAVAAQAVREWRPILYGRFGQSQELTANLRAMRERIARETPPGRRGMKTGKGGYYDIDFALSRHALAHPEIELEGLGLSGLARRLGGLDGGNARAIPAAAARTLALGATLLRASDHALRVVMGKAPAQPPESGHAEQETHRLLERIVGRRLEGSVAALMEQARREIRAVYDELLPAGRG